MASRSSKDPKDPKTKGWALQPHAGLWTGSVQARFFCLAMAGSADRTGALSRIPNYFTVNGLRLCNS